jgi:ABC-type transporter Mla subunit MlaD
MISEKAGALEAAGINGNLEFILEHTEEFESSLRKMLDDIGDVISSYNASHAGDSSIDADELMQRLHDLKEALENVDIDTIDENTEFLRGFVHNPQFGGPLSEILENAFIGEYALAIANIESLLK